MTIVASKQRLWLQHWLPHWLQLALPNHCALCGNLSQRSVCSACDTTLAAAACPRCPRCALCLETEGPATLCGACLAKPPSFDATLVLADYAAPYDTLAQALKFAARLGLAHWFADQLALRAQAASKFDLMIPVPLSARRLALRGYNQSWQIAKPLARHLQVPASWSRLRRLRDTAPQTTLSSAQARCDNVRGAFAVDAGCVRHAHIAVVDDVMTSGATLAEIARTLKRAGAASVTNLVALRTPAP